MLLLLPIFDISRVAADSADGGLVVEKVDPHSVADLAGLVAGDIILEADGKPLYSPFQLWGLWADTLKKGATQRLTVRSMDGKSRTCTLVIDAVWQNNDIWTTNPLVVRPPMSEQTLAKYLAARAADNAARAARKALMTPTGTYVTFITLCNRADELWTVAADAAKNQADLEWIAHEAGTLVYDVGRHEKARAWWERSLAQISGRRKSAFWDKAHLLRDLGNAELSLGHFDIASQKYEQAKIFALSAGAQVWYGRCLESMGDALRRAKHFPEAKDAYDEAAVLFDRLHPETNETAHVFNRFGLLADSQGNYGTALVYYKRALEYMESRKWEMPSTAQFAANCGSVLLKLKKYDEAIPYYEKALALWRTTDAAAPTLASAFSNLGSAESNAGRVADAEEHLHEAIKILEKASPQSADLADGYYKLGDLCWYADRLAEARTLFTNSLEIEKKVRPNTPEIARTLFRIGQVCESQNDFVASVQSYQDAISLYEAAAEKAKRETDQDKHRVHELELAATYSNLGDVYRDQGNYVVAKRWYLSALEIQQYYNVDRDIATSYNDLGAVASALNDDKTALQFCSAALTMRRNNPECNPSELAVSLYAVADSLHDRNSQQMDSDGLNDRRRAYQYLREAIQIDEENNPDTLTLADDYSLMGDFVLDRGGKDSARGARIWYDKAYDIRKRRVPGTLTEASSFGDLARLAGEVNDETEMHRLYQAELMIRRRLAPKAIDTANVLDKEGVAFLNEGKPTDALPYFRDAIEIVEGQRSRIASEEKRRLFLEDEQDKYDHLVRCYLELNQNADAWEAAERARARAFAEHLSHQHLADLKQLPSSFIMQRKTLENQRSIETAKLNRARKDSNSAIEARAQAALEQIASAESEMISQFHQTNPRLAALLYPRPLTLKEAQEALDPGTLLLYYFVSAKSTYLFSLTRDDGVQVWQVKESIADLRKAVRAFYRDLSDVSVDPKMRIAIPKSQTFKPQATLLYEQLIRPVQRFVNKAKRILICPEDVLNKLPFAALWDATPSGTAPGVYLIQRKPLIYTASMTVLKRLTDINVTADAQSEFLGTPKVVAVANPIYPLKTGMTVPQKVDSVVNVTASGQPQGKKTETMEAKSPGILKAIAPQGSRVVAAATQEGRRQHSKINSRTFAKPTGAKFVATLKLNTVRTLMDATTLDDLTPVPETEQQVKSLEILFKGQVVSLVKEKATRSQIDQNSLNAFLLHFGCHGLPGKNTPFDAALAISRDPSKPGDDGLLRASDIAGSLRFPHAKLVMLSACQTGQGKTTSEGILGLTQAFHFAGAQDVVATLWRVRMDSTLILTDRFYKAYAGMPVKKLMGNVSNASRRERALLAPEALQAAQCTILTDPRYADYRHPFFWAAFLVDGPGR